MNHQPNCGARSHAARNGRPTVPNRAARRLSANEVRLTRCDIASGTETIVAGGTARSVSYLSKTRYETWRLSMGRRLTRQ